MILLSFELLHALAMQRRYIAVAHCCTHRTVEICLFLPESWHGH